MAFPSNEEDRSEQGGSAPFRLRATDGHRYWAKVLNNPQSDRVPITEQIVGRAAALLPGDVFCVVRTVYIRKEFAGWKFDMKRNLTLEAGCAHGSREVEGAVEPNKGDAFGQREQDDNARRHVHYYAVHDWCWGHDVASLRVPTDEDRFYSHDHGYFLPPNGATWSVDELLKQVDTEHPLTRPEGDAGLDIVEVQRVADRLENISRAELVEVLTMVPRAWPVEDAELEAVGFFLERRAPQVAKRLRERFGGS